MKVGGNFASFMLVGSLRHNEKLTVGCHAYAVRYATSKARVGEVIWSEERAEKDILAGYKTAVLQSRKLKKVFLERWAESQPWSCRKAACPSKE